MQDKQQLILALDQGTTSSRAILFNQHGQIISKHSETFRQIMPSVDIIEHDPKEIWHTQLLAAQLAISAHDSYLDSITAIGVTNQRETTIMWNKQTGLPVYNAIVWQDRRTAAYIDALKAQKGMEELVQAKTGLTLDAYFSASKANWIISNVSKAKQLLKNNDLLFGTIDTWIIWHLSAGKLHITDYSNASRTMLFNIHQGDWDSELLALFEIPRSVLPRVVNSSEIVGYVSTEIFARGGMGNRSCNTRQIPLAGVAGDQMAASFGNLCFTESSTKVTYGTGCFLSMNTANKVIASRNRLLSSIAWSIPNKSNATNNSINNSVSSNKTTTVNEGSSLVYCLEGSVFIGGALIQWLRDGLGIIKTASEVEALASSVSDSAGVMMVPALTGLGAPYWQQQAKGIIAGISRHTHKGHIARAALEAITYEVADVVAAMQKDANCVIRSLRVDGGACTNNLLMQLQADILGIPVIRPQILELTALGVAYLAGLAVGVWRSDADLITLKEPDDYFMPNMSAHHRQLIMTKWHELITKTYT